MLETARVDFPLVHRPAIKAHGTPRKGKATLEANLEGTTLNLLSRPGAASAAEIIAALESRGPFSMRAAGPGQWLVVFDRLLVPHEIDECENDLKGTAYVVDQTHGRVRIRLQGSAARCVLAKGTGVDLHPDVFAIGSSAMTLIGHIGVNLARIDTDAFELLVLRNFAESLWHELEHMSNEFF